jgi:CRP-like cAMP-binding protein
VRAHDGPRVLGEVAPGGCVGEMAALDDAPRTATVSAIEELRALVLPGDDFKALLDARPTMARAVLRVLSGRLRGMISTQRTAS